ncbi:MAG: ParB N-terminal domain-containing protein [Actinobacteria bacterium]|nr:ParB N-terminal domain-containing protein [Actinomycetota bacterium]MBA3567453.1 ParB N-terminal domain-containing protein [Actinomycetota bacterium]
MNLELSTLVLKYAALRVLDPGRVARLVGAMSREDQRSPVLVVGEGVLVDGYHRVQALRQLGRDLVAAVRLEVTEAEALVLAWRLETGRRKSALEEGWLLAELAETHGRTQVALAADLHRTRSWVSQRLGLVRVLPEDVQEAVRTCKIPAQAAMKSLLPLARADRDACSRLSAAAKEPLTVRQWDRICTAWRKAPPEVRRRIEENPGLLLKTEEAVSVVPVDAEEKLVQDLEGVAGLCRRARRQVRDGAFARANDAPCRAAWTQAREAFVSLEREVDRAEPRDA